MTRLVPYTSTHGLRSYRGMNDLIDDFFRESANEGFISSSFKVDVQKYDDKFVVTADVPGLEKKDVNLELEDGVLSINVNHEDKTDEEDEENNYIHRERRAFSATRRISLGDVDAENIEANLDKGVLTVTVPLLPEVTNKKTIEIK